MSRAFGTCGEIIVDGGGGVQLAPDLNFITDKPGNQTTKEITGIDGSSGFATALSLTGKYAIYVLGFGDLINENVTVRMTVDGVIVYNSTGLAASNDMMLFGQIGGGNNQNDSFVFETSLLLEIQTTTDNNCSLRYSARPIL